ncbi:poly(A) polymerase [Devosia yakushimensis]|uniref:Poly(A) polymerase n=1 Tax=Devosia yakushimensis TaxID=470028 RepID=A0ABQ5UBF0_9HYPH|nr:CCA tRNA nucleotidyltransferase [Devosia yakushimensis]GLQ08500.1 poly(A) polymerase [Devosia yakushimensis]
MSPEERLARAEWLVRPETQAIFAALDGDKGRTRAVGGVVRDTLLDRERDNPDIDLATELSPEEVIARAEANGIAHYPTGIDHGTVTLKLGETLAEVTTLRRDVETDGRHAIVAFGTDWAEDAARRDFTLNALYCGADGALFDPLGGINDALNGRIRFIGDAAGRIAEDGLRVYRFFRFSASHGGEKLDADGLAACAAAVGQLGHLSAERIGAEMLRMLALPDIAQTLGAMAAIGLIAVDADQLRTLKAYEELGGFSSATRLAVFIGGRDADDLQKQWRLSNEVMRAAQTVAGAADTVEEDRLGEAAYRFGEAAVEGLALAAARGGWKTDRLAEAARSLAAVQLVPFPISGNDLAGLGMKPGPALGQELARLERLWIDSGFALDREALLAQVRR